MLTKISFVDGVKLACPCHHHYARNPVETHIVKPGQGRLMKTNNRNNVYQMSLKVEYVNKKSSVNLFNLWAVVLEVNSV